MKRILIPTDFSECANTAFNAGIEIAQKFNAEVDILHIINSAYDWVELPLNLEKYHPETRKEIAEARGKITELIIKAKKINVKANEFIVYNKSYHGIIEHCQKYNNDLLIMGTYGSKGVKKIIGSHTLHVLKHSEIPALSVKKDFRITNLNQLTFASDFENPNPEMINLLKEFSRKFNLKINLLYVNTPLHFEDSTISTKKMKAITSQYLFENYSQTIYNSFSVQEGILKFNEGTNSLTIIEYHQTSRIENIFNPNVTEYLLNYTSALLAFPDPEYVLSHK